MTTHFQQTTGRRHRRGLFHTFGVIIALLFLSCVAFHWAWSVVLVPHFGLPPLKFANIFAIELAVMTFVAVISKVVFLLGGWSQRPLADFAD